MQIVDLSILIPARNEEFTAKTIEDILKNSEANTEVIVVLDGEPANPPITPDDRVTIIQLEESIGQRASTTLACELAKGKYVAKVDAHCSFDKGFDRKMLEAFKKSGDEVVMVPIMRNLWAFDWKCMKCGKKWYQGPTPTECKEDNYKGTGVKCDSKEFKKKIMWVGKNNPQSRSFCFDSEPHFQYFNAWRRSPIYNEQLKTGLTETMSLQGSFFMCTKENYLNLISENFGSWGNQGLEVATAFWLTGRRVLVNHSTWYAHLFRTQGGDFGFQYPNPENEIKVTKNKIRDRVFNNKIPGQIYPVSWLVEKFWPVPGWTQEQLDLLKEGKL